MLIKLRAIFDSPDMADIAVARLRSNNVLFNTIELQHIRPRDSQNAAWNTVNILYPYPSTHSPGQSYSLNGQNTSLSMRAVLGAGWGTKKIQPGRRGSSYRYHRQSASSTCT